ncbi:hypothetical protein EJ065_3233 [Corallococcus coralloides]|uniref:Uncharacterized protein n=1 Tax=Corallococcus coralloides TaxID=184914 RepID=A0A410RSC2_CORCK|nr:hypothetical protein EJ065_3233 [Corallococcus coralloides]
MPKVTIEVPEGFEDSVKALEERKRPPRAATPAIPHGTSLAGRLPAESANDGNVRLPSGVAAKPEADGRIPDGQSPNP